ncbi:hypothetical protein PG985_005617 [Apiospora marii]|uniref:Uncharacterized protein n=1 Tax=Apiospora marii TaxID=335849 RepID=A0ABR1RKW4_9PEZI
MIVLYGPAKKSTEYETTLEDSYQMYRHVQGKGIRLRVHDTGGYDLPELLMAGVLNTLCALAMRWERLFPKTPKVDEDKNSA